MRSSRRDRLGSFTAAAEALGVAQASISELVRRLEDELDAQLFVRGSRRLALTAAGEELLPYARAGRCTPPTAGAQAVRSLGSLGGGTATFGVPRNADYYLLSSLVQTFHTALPRGAGTAGRAELRRDRRGHCGR